MSDDRIFSRMEVLEILVRIFGKMNVLKVKLTLSDIDGVWDVVNDIVDYMGSIDFSCLLTDAESTRSYSKDDLKKALEIAFSKGITWEETMELLDKIYFL